MKVDGTRAHQARGLGATQAPSRVPNRGRDSLGAQGVRIPGAKWI